MTDDWLSEKHMWDIIEILRWEIGDYCSIPYRISSDGSCNTLYPAATLLCFTVLLLYWGYFMFIVLGLLSHFVWGGAGGLFHSTMVCALLEVPFVGGGFGECFVSAF